METITGIAALLSYVKSGKDAIDILNQSKIFPFVSKSISSLIDKKKLNEELKNYFSQNAKNNSYLNTIVFQNEPKFIQDVYVPLTLEKITKDNQSFRLDNNFNIEEILAHDKILIVDYAGMGKSTCSKWLYLSCLSSKDHIPFLIELRNLSKTKGIKDLIQEDINLKHNLFNDQTTDELLSCKNIVFFLDGLDEIEGDNRTEILSQLTKFQKKYSQAIYIMTSRPDESLVGIKGFIRFKIKPFDNEEAFLLIHKYDPEDKLAGKIISEIERSQNELVLKEFLGNPLSVSLLFTSYCFTPLLTFNKIQFYDNIFEALYERHDFSKGDGFCRPRFCNLSKSDFLKMLCRIGMETCLVLKKVSFSYPELCEVISNSKKYFSLEFDIDLLIKDLKQTVPFLIEDGASLKWSHKTFQDYYTAYFLRFHYDKKIEVLEKISTSDRYYAILDFYYGLDDKGFKKYLLKNELKKILNKRDEILVKVKNVELANSLVNMFYSDEMKIQYYVTETDILDVGDNDDKISNLFREVDGKAFGSRSKKVSLTKIVEFKNNSKKLIAIYFSINPCIFPMVINLAVRKNVNLKNINKVYEKIDELSFLRDNYLESITVESFINFTNEHLVFVENILRTERCLNIVQVENEYENILEIENNEKLFEIKI